jgi:D-sedoheptulose 7-phosphate isomerase
MVDHMATDAPAIIGKAALQDHFPTVSDLLCDVAVTARDGASLDFADAATAVMARARATHAAGDKLIFVGNGGSATIASHMATDYSKNGGVRALARYGFVEIGHLTICHAVLDFLCGLPAPVRPR